MPDLGPSPPPEPLTPERIEEMRVADLEASWALVVGTYPDAVRPEATFVGFIDKDTTVSVLRECFEANGVPIDEGRSSPDLNGPVTSIGSSVATEAQAVGNFICHAQHPVKPMSAMSAAQLGYVYDYLTKFLVPCYASFGIVNEPAPSREFFVENWPRQNWFPSAFANEMSLEVDPAIEEHCPPDE
ncbi:hypothetical protein GY21_06525 [Cryobacterium roopkundense]|nr:hypothetical protein GY21_06525 [Cryobacterium roopkundense]